VPEAPKKKPVMKIKRLPEHQGLFGSKTLWRSDQQSWVCVTGNAGSAPSLGKFRTCKIDTAAGSPSYSASHERVNAFSHGEFIHRRREKQGTAGTFSAVTGQMPCSPASAKPGPPPPLAQFESDAIPVASLYFFDQS
jgi:hypothetical protein